jgi:hypothetical protein
MKWKETRKSSSRVLVIYFSGDKDTLYFARHYPTSGLTNLLYLHFLFFLTSYAGLGNLLQSLVSPHDRLRCSWLQLTTG